jgi:glycosyltransferase involved in cell wall biosynthesis
MNELPAHKSDPSPPLVLCAKSKWDPPVRREHAWSALAAAHGHSVSFLESPLDVREVRDGSARAWLSGCLDGCERDVAPSLVVKQRSTLVPGHRGRLAAALDSLFLRRSLRAVTPALSGASVVCCWPWDWPAVSAVPARRRIFDMADDWGELMPGRTKRFARLYRRIAAEADEIVIVNPDLARHFPARDCLLIRNGVSKTLIEMPSAVPGTERTLAYVGTLTPRFDAELVRRILEILPDWRLELVGPCMYPGRGGGPDSDFQQLLDVGSRVRWHGPLSRERATDVIDRSTVAIVPNRPDKSLGQDSMKLYDYAARGRPIVSTQSNGISAAASLPHVRLAGSADDFAKAILDAASEPPEYSTKRREWAQGHTWQERWPAWSGAVFGARDV